MEGLCEKPQHFSTEGSSFPECLGEDLPLLLCIASGERSRPGGTSPRNGYTGDHGGEGLLHEGACMRMHPIQL